MSIRDDFFTAKNNGAKWDVGVSINRTNPLPLDVNSVFDTRENLNAYVAGVLSYPGQLVALVEESGTTIYYIDQEKNLQEVGTGGGSGGSTITVVDNLNSTSTASALSANQGRVLKERIKYYDDPDIVPSNEVYFTVNSTKETITGLTDAGKTQTELVIPYEIDGIKITTLSGSMGKSILDGATDKITKVVIPNSVSRIKAHAFNGCTSLTSINIPNRVTSIGEYAFYSCTGLTSITIPNSVTSIDVSAFDGCTALTSINIPSSVTSIGGYAFSATALKSITIPNSVTSIEYCAFMACKKLTAINIPNSVTSIRYSTFDGCTALKSINIPSSVTSIESETFYGCTALKSITIPNSVTSIDDSAFNGCTNLTIYCEQGSYAETYAKTINIPVVYTDVKAEILNGKVDKASLIEATAEDIDNWIGTSYTTSVVGEATAGNAIVGM